MSAEAVMRVLRHSKAKGSDRLVMLVIAWHVDKDSGEAWVGMQTLARECNLEERSARRCVQNIERLGELQISRGGGMQSNHYRIVTPDTGVTPTPVAHDTPPLSPLSPPPLSPESGDPGHMRQGTPVMDDRTPLSPTTPVKNFKEKSKSESGRKTPLPPGFNISERVKAWASAKGYGQLEEHLDVFIGKAHAHNYRYADWDAALMEAIRADWAKLRTSARASGNGYWGAQHSNTPLDWYATDQGWQAKARELGINECDFVMLQAKVCKRLGPGTWVDERNGTLMRLINELPEAA